MLRCFTGFYNILAVNILSYIISYRFLRYPLFKLVHFYINILFKIQGKKSSISYSTKQQWWAMLDAILFSLDNTIKAGAVSMEVARQVANLWLNVLFSSSKNRAVLEFKKSHNQSPPAFIVISPGKSCNLACNGCYANSDSKEVKLDWDVTNRVIEDAKKLWGIKLVTFSGGEPLLYHSDGKNILDIVAAHPDLLFLMFTNGTLIDENIALRMREMGNLTPAISVEGLEKTTDRQRGSGIFKRIQESMDYMRKAGVPFGISVTVNSKNVEEVVSGEFLDFFFLQQKVFYAFYFQYLPIGRIINLKNMPTPEQRLKFYRVVQNTIRRRRYFIIDFWNHGNLVNGCIAAGREDGYLYIDWEGKVMPCVFVPYSVGNINDIYLKDGSFDNLWQSSFFKAIRDWQKEYANTGIDDIPVNLKWLMPCPFRDHYDRFHKWVKQFNPEPEDDEAEKVIGSEAYKNYMCDYGRRLAELIKSDKGEMS